MCPIASVVVPTHRRPAYLSAALSSIEEARIAAAISSSEVEIVVIDDGHDGATQLLCENAHARWTTPVRYERSSSGPNGGPAPCRNQGIRAARGQIIYLLDDDDVFLPCRFNTSVPLLTKGGFDVVLEPSLRVNLSNPLICAYITGPYGNAENAFRFLMTGGPRSHVTPGATSFRKATFLKTGGYDETLRYGEDGELLLRLCLAGRVALVDGEPVVRITIHSDNSTRADRLQPWQNIKALSSLYRRLHKGNWREEAHFLKSALSGKLDYVLTECRKTSSYPDRLRQGALALRWFDWRCTTVNNLKSIVVWLTKRA